MRLPSSHPSGKCRAFTLTELLVTIFLASTLLGLAAYALRPNDSRQARVAAAEQVTSLLHLTRRQAINRGAPVALAMVRPGDSDSSGHADLLGIFLLSEENSDATPEQSGNWHKLPAGIVWDTSSPDEARNFFETGFNRLSVRLPGGKLGLLPCIIFASDGSVLSPRPNHTRIVFRLASGTVRNGEVRINSRTPENHANAESVYILTTTGRARYIE